MSDRKDKIKNIAIVFLSIMLVLTFFSNTIMNYSLVEVSTEAVQSDSITTKVRGSGTVEAAEGYSVTIEESRKIAAVNVKTGAEVEKGDVLFVLEDSDGEELKAAREQLEAAEDAYEAAVLESGITVEERKAIESGQISSLTDRQNTMLNAEAEAEAAQQYLDEMRAKASATDMDLTEETAAVENTKSAYEAAQADLAQKISEAEAAANHYYAIQADFDMKIASGIVPTPEEEAALQTAKADMDIKAAERQAAEENCNNAKAAYEAAQNAFDTKQQNIWNVQDACYYAGERLKEAQEALEHVDTLYPLQISLGSQYEKLCNLREEVNELAANAIDAEIVSPMAGTVTEIFCYAGQTVTPETVMMQIKPESEAYTLQFTVTENQARRIKVGDPAEILYNWSGDDVTARVQSIRKDPMNKSSSIVICELTGEVSVGDYYTLSIGEQSSDYDYVVPTSCIREDSNGKFILTVEAKSTPLGNRYYARRTDVEVITSDDSRSAITGAIEDYVYVITTTTKPVEENQQVRLAE